MKLSEVAKLLDEAQFSIVQRYIPSLFSAKYSRYCAQISTSKEAQNKLDAEFGLSLGLFKGATPEAKRALLFTHRVKLSEQFALVQNYDTAYKQLHIALTTIKADLVDFTTRNEALRNLSKLAELTGNPSTMCEANETQIELLTTHQVPFDIELLENIGQQLAALQSTLTATT